MELEKEAPPCAPLPSPTPRPDGGGRPLPFTLANTLGSIRNGKYLAAPSTGTPAQQNLRHAVLWSVQGVHELATVASQALALCAQEVTQKVWGTRGSLFVLKGGSFPKIDRWNTLKNDPAANVGALRRADHASTARAAALLVVNAFADIFDPRSPSLCRTADKVNDARAVFLPLGSPLRAVLLKSGVLLDDAATAAERARLAVRGFDPFNPHSSVTVDLQKMPNDVTVLEVMHAAIRADLGEGLTFYGQYFVPGAPLVSRVRETLTLPADQRDAVLAERRQVAQDLALAHPHVKKECEAIGRNMVVPSVVPWTASVLRDIIKSVTSTLNTASQVTANAAFSRDKHYVAWHIMLSLSCDFFYTCEKERTDVYKLVCGKGSNDNFAGLGAFLDRVHPEGLGDQQIISAAVGWYAAAVTAASTIALPGTTAFHVNLRSRLEADLLAMRALSPGVSLFHHRQILAARSSGDPAQLAAAMAASSAAQNISGVYREKYLQSFPLPTISPIFGVEENFYAVSPQMLVEMYNYLQARPPMVRGGKDLARLFGFTGYNEKMMDGDGDGDDGSAKLRELAVTHPRRLLDLQNLVGMVISLDAAHAG